MSSVPQDKNSIEMARETLRRLAIDQKAPTPGNFHRAYEQIAGEKCHYLSSSSRELLTELVSQFCNDTPELNNFLNALETSDREETWSKLKTAFDALIDAQNTGSGNISEQQKTAEKENQTGWGETIDLLLKKLEARHGALTTAKKRESLNWVLNRFSSDSVLLHEKLNALINSWQVSASTASKQPVDRQEAGDLSETCAASQPIADNSSLTAESKLPGNTVLDVSLQLRQILNQMLNYVATIQLGDSVLPEEAQSLANSVMNAHDRQSMEQLVPRLEQFGSMLKKYCDLGPQLQQGLFRLFNLLIDRTGRFMPNDDWMQDQIALLRETLSGGLDLVAIECAEERLTKIVKRQDQFSIGVDETKSTLKKMVTCLVSNIESLTDSTGEYQDKMEQFSTKLNQADGPVALNQLLEEIISETDRVKTRMNTSREEILAARAEVEAAHNKIQQLESEIVQLGEKVHEDHLTGVLNRRGLEHVFVREVSRSERMQKPMSLALLDLDNFKQLNDKLGHSAGDHALVFLVQAVKETTRPSDIVARFGGEEFVILLPDASADLAASVVTRVQRNLTKRLFMHENQRVLITFSAGVVQYQTGDSQDSMVVRADKALYQAKKNGKNQVVIG